MTRSRSIGFSSAFSALSILLVAISIPAAFGATHEVAILSNLTFNPDSLEIQIGDTVHWVNTTLLQHTVSAGDSASDPNIGDPFEGELILNGDHFEYVFESEGRFPYVCRYHYNLTGLTNVVVVGQITGILDDEVDNRHGDNVPPAIELSGFPNPFNSSVAIRINVHSDTRANLNIYDILGRRVCTLLHGGLVSGTLSVNWDGRDDKGGQLSTGIYFARFTSEHGVSTMKLMLLK